MSQRDDVFSDFIKNAEILGDEEKRKELIDILYTHFFEDDYYTTDRLERLTSDKKWKNYIDSLIHITRDKFLRILTQGNELLSAKITLDLAKWIEENYQRLKKNEEIVGLKKDFNSFIEKSNSYSKEDWEQLLKKLKETYPEFGEYWKFYEKKIHSIMSNMEKAQKQSKKKKYEKLMKELETVRNSLIEEYQKALSKKIDEIEKEELKKSAFSLKKDLIKHEEQLNNFIETMGCILGFLGGRGSLKKSGFGMFSGILSGEAGEEANIFSNVPGRFWDLSLGSWKVTIDWAVIERYAKILEENEQIKKLAEMLGKLREAEDEYETKLIEKTKIVHDWKVDYAGKSEIKGVHFSDDLSNLLPSEIALLSIPETEVLFAKKFVEKKLLTFYYEDKYRVEKEIPEMVEKKMWKKSKKGPIIACVDTSGSMAGVPEIVAKTIILALLRIAIRDDRDCYLISFSTGIQTIDISDIGQNMEKLIAFLQMGFHGGTDATPALIESLRMLNEEKYEKADVVMISDFIMGNIPEAIKKNMEDQKKNKTKFHSIVISSQANPNVIKIFDNVWIVDFNYNYDDLLVRIKNIEEVF